MKKTFLFILFAIFGFIANANAQVTMSFGTTNAHTVSQSGLTYNVSIPFFASNLTGNFKITRPSFNCTTPGSIKTMSVNNFNTGVFIVNNGNSNTNYVNLPNTYTFPVGTTILRVRSECYSPASPSNPVYHNITVTVSKLPDPALNITLTPYCQIDNHTGNYTNYFGYKVSGSAINRNGLRFKVVPDNTQACPTQTYCNLNTTFTFTGNNFNPGLGFYSCNFSTWYNVYLEYVYTPYGSNTQVVYPIANNTYGWLNHRWRKTFSTCLPILEEEENDPKLPGKSAQSQISVFPNPTDGIVSFNIDNDTEIKSVVVYDMSNVKLLSFDKLKSKEIDLSSLKNGIYFIHIETDNGIFKKQIIKK